MENRINFLKVISVLFGLSGGLSVTISVVVYIAGPLSVLFGIFPLFLILIPAVFVFSLVGAIDLWRCRKWGLYILSIFAFINIIGLFAMVGKNFNPFIFGSTFFQVLSTVYLWPKREQLN